MARGKLTVVYSPPDGIQRHNVTTPDGTAYFVPYREPFEIDESDREWFFERWVHGPHLSVWTPPPPPVKRAPALDLEVPSTEPAPLEASTPSNRASDGRRRTSRVSASDAPSVRETGSD